MSVVRVLCLDRGEVAAGVFVEPSVVVPVDPFGGREFDLVEGAPGPAFDDLGLVQAVDRFGQGVDAPIAVKLCRVGGSRG